MSRKSKGKNFIISVIGRDFRKTPESEEERKGDPSGSSPQGRSLLESPSQKKDAGKSQILKRDRTHYRIEYTKDGPKFWTLH